MLMPSELSATALFNCSRDVFEKVARNVPFTRVACDPYQRRNPLNG
jgi:hypothetical protein